MTCILCYCGVTERGGEAIERVLSGFLNIDQVETLERQLAEETDYPGGPDRLCSDCLVQLMAGAV